MEELRRQQREKLLDATRTLPRTTTKLEVRSVSTDGMNTSHDARSRASGSTDRGEGRQSSTLETHSSQPSVRPKTRTSIGSLGSQATAVSRDGQPRQDPGVEGPRRSASLTALQMRPRTPGSSLAPRVLALDSSFQSLTLQQSSGLLVCLYCSGGHALDQCLKFGGLSVPELKLTFLRERGICFACLNRGHMSVGATMAVTFSAFLNGEYPPADLTGDVAVSYSSPTGVPRVAQCKFFLPLRLVCCPTSTSKNAKYKVTVDTNKPPVNLNKVFPDFAEKSEDKEGNAMAFHFISGARVTVLASKTSQRYRIQSDSFEDIWLVAKELVQRFDSHFQALGVKDFRNSFSGPIPLSEYFETVDQHFELRVSAEKYQDLLSERAVQFRAIQRRLLTRFKDKTPAPLQNLDTLMEGTYRQVIALADAAEDNRALLERAFSRLRSASHLLILLVTLWQGLGPEQSSILEATLLPLLHDTPQLGWEESVDAAVSHLLRTCLSRSPKDQALSLASSQLTMPRDTARLKKHITLLCDRLAKGGRLSLSSEANAPTPLLLPGGVEPITEAPADLEEPPLEMESAAKFIKKKQPSKKVKKEKDSKEKKAEGAVKELLEEEEPAKEVKKEKKEKKESSTKEKKESSSKEKESSSKEKESSSKEKKESSSKEKKESKESSKEPAKESKKESSKEKKESTKESSKEKKESTKESSKEAGDKKVSRKTSVKVKEKKKEPEEGDGVQ